MKAAAISVTAFTIVCILSFFNSFYIKDFTEELCMEIDTLTPEDAVKFNEAYLHYKEAERLISLTVSHDDLTNIEEFFAEILGALKAKDDVTVEIAKSRLLDALRHLGRLSGINADSIM